MSSSENSAESYTDSEYEIEAEGDLDLEVSPPTSDDEANASGRRVDSSIRKGKREGKGAGTRVNKAITGRYTSQ